MSYADATLEWTRRQYDESGRLKSVAMFKGSEPDCQTTSNWTGLTQMQYDIDTQAGLPRVRVIDPAGAIRDEERDALGRLVRVVEAPLVPNMNYQTTYGYDPLDKLTQVVQGVQTRTFSYTTLSRLGSAVNPENGTTGYTYYASGDLRTRTDVGRNIVSSFAYDALHRMLTKGYSDGTSPVTYEYYLPGTGSSPNIGQLQSMTSSAASTVYNLYDNLGHVKTSTHSVSGLTGSYAFGYQWWLNDGLKEIDYPSGRVVKYDVDDAGRVQKVYGTSPSSRTYADMTATGITTPYAADGRLAQMQLGNGLYDSREYHTPGTTTLYKLGTSAGGSQRLKLEYNFHATDNNGNLISHGITNGSSAWTQSFGYDGVNRLSTASETNGFSRIYRYDQYGNRWVDPSSSGLSTTDIHEPTVPSNFDANTNRLILQGSDYDPAGNQRVYTPYTLGYDAENRNTSITSASNGNMAFAYDGDGRRVKKEWTPYGGGTTTTYYVYNALGQLLAEYSNQTPTGGTWYPFTDMLGSVRAVSNSSGTLAECYDYLPFGRMLGSADNGRSTAGCYPNLSQTLSSQLPQKFTGKERDQETGLDFFGARYLSAAQGRFTSPDPIYVQKEMLVDPQRWNLYAYVRNNPLAFIDRHGEAIELTGDEEERKRLLEAIRAAVGSKAAPYLYQNEIKDSDGKTRFFVGIYSGGPDGKGPDLSDLGVPAAVVSDLVRTKDVIGFHLAKSNTTVEGGGRIGRADLGMTPGVTNPRTLQVTILDPAAQYGSSPPAIMQDNQRTPLDPGIVTIHEFGHVAYMLGLLIPGPTKRAAVDLENHLRRLRNPNGPIRLLHDLP